MFLATPRLPRLAKSYQTSESIIKMLGKSNEMTSFCGNADSQRETLLRTGPIPWKLHPIDFVDRFLSENLVEKFQKTALAESLPTEFKQMFPTNQRTEYIQEMSSPQNQRTSRENDRYEEEYQRQSILNRDSCSPENRRNAEHERRKLSHRRISLDKEPQQSEYRSPQQDRGRYQQLRFQYEREYDRRESYPYYWCNDAPPSRTHKKWKSRGDTRYPRRLDTNPRSHNHNRGEPREKRNSRPRSTIQSEPPSTAVTDQAPSTSALPADGNAAEDALEPISEDDEDGSQRTSPEQNAASQTVLPPPEQAAEDAVEPMSVDDENGSQRTSLAQNAAGQTVLPRPEQAPSSSTQVISQPHVDNPAKNPPEKSSPSSQTGSKRTFSEQIAASQTVLPPPEQAASSSTQASAGAAVDNAAKNLPEKSSTSSQNGSKNQSSVQIASNHQTASSSSSGPASTTSVQTAVRTVTENPANKTEHGSRNSNTESTNVKKDRVPAIVLIVKKFSCLYAEPYKKNQTEKEKAWAAISQELNEPVKDCQNKWRSQCTKHRRILKETDGQNFGRYADFMAAMNFLPPPKNHSSKDNTLWLNATMDQAQTEQAVSQSVPDVDQQFAQAMVGELRQFPPGLKPSIKSDIYQVFAKYKKLI